MKILRQAFAATAWIGACLPRLAAQAPLFGEPPAMFPAIVDRTQALAFGDVDGDGDLDLYLGNGLQPFGLGEQDRLYLNDGFGGFADATSQLPAFVSATFAIALGDVDGDGDLDAMIASTGDGLYLNDGSGVFQSAPLPLPPGTLTYVSWAVALGDVDGDGDLDALFGKPGPERLLLNDGTGAFTDASAQLPYSIYMSPMTQDVLLGDVDADGDLDAFLVNGFGHPYQHNHLFMNDGFGVFTDATVLLPPIVGNFVDGAFGDVDGDGDLDVLLANASGPNLLLLNFGSGAFANASWQVPPSPGTTPALDLGDVDGDGDLDLLMGKVGSTSPVPDRLYLNDGTGVFADASGALPGIVDATGAVALADVDGDGDLDALVANFGYSGGKDRLYLNDGSGTFGDVTADIPAVSDITRGVALGDLDGDGDLDAVTADFWEDRLYRNDGANRFLETTGLLPPVLDDTRAVSLGDLDGDGDLDAFLANAGADLLYLNDGSGAFASAPLLTNSGESRAVALGDLDGDGDLDAWVGVGGLDRLYANDGSAGFADVTAAQVPSSLDTTRAVALGDVDGDGDLDLLAGNLGQNRLLLNDGLGAFADATAQLPFLDDDTHALALGDVDGDGDLDLLAGNLGQNRLALNDGLGVFTDATAARLPAILGYTYAVGLGDVDEDGDLDALVGNGAHPSASYPNAPGDFNRLYLNDGAGVFTIATSSLPAVLDATRALAIGDADGDGDLDVVFGNDFREDRFLSNLRRQLFREPVPRIGMPLALELRGPPWGGAILAFSLAAATIAVPPFGTLRLDPAAIHPVSTAVLDAQGRASVVFAVPSNPALVGSTVYWQALVGSPARFTNLETTTLHDY